MRSARPSPGSYRFSLNELSMFAMMFHVTGRHIKIEEEIVMPKVKLTITDSRCRSGYFKKGQEYIVEDLCPPLCHELWNSIYPLVYALLNGAELDYGNVRAKMFDAQCPDECRVSIHGEIMED